MVSTDDMISPFTTDDGTSTYICEGINWSYSVFHFYASALTPSPTSNAPLMHFRSSGRIALPSMTCG